MAAGLETRWCLRKTTLSFTNGWCQSWSRCWWSRTLRCVFSGCLCSSLLSVESVLNNPNSYIYQALNSQHLNHIMKEQFLVLFYFNLLCYACGSWDEMSWSLVWPWAHTKVFLFWNVFPLRASAGLHLRWSIVWVRRSTTPSLFTTGPTRWVISFSRNSCDCAD